LLKTLAESCQKTRFGVLHLGSRNTLNNHLYGWRKTNEATT
jgi:hypothetical protein